MTRRIWMVIPSCFFGSAVSCKTGFCPRIANLDRNMMNQWIDGYPIFRQSQASGGIESMKLGGGLFSGKPV